MRFLTDILNFRIYVSLLQTCIRTIVYTKCLPTPITERVTLHSTCKRIQIFPTQAGAISPTEALSA